MATLPNVYETAMLINRKFENHQLSYRVYPERIGNTTYATLYPNAEDCDGEGLVAGTTGQVNTWLKAFYAGLGVGVLDRE